MIPAKSVSSRLFCGTTVLANQNTGDIREKKGLETFLSFERYRGILDAQRAGMSEREHIHTVADQVFHGFPVGVADPSLFRPRVEPGDPFRSPLTTRTVLISSCVP